MSAFLTHQIEVLKALILESDLTPVLQGSVPPILAGPILARRSVRVEIVLDSRGISKFLEIELCSVGTFFRKCSSFWKRIRILREFGWIFGCYGFAILVAKSAIVNIEAIPPSLTASILSGSIFLATFRSRAWISILRRPLKPPKRSPARARLAYIARLARARLARARLARASLWKRVSDLCSVGTLGCRNFVPIGMQDTPLGRRRLPTLIKETQCNLSCTDPSEKCGLTDPLLQKLSWMLSIDPMPNVHIFQRRMFSKGDMLKPAEKW